MSSRPISHSTRTRKSQGSSLLWVAVICGIILIAGLRYVFSSAKDTDTGDSSDTLSGQTTYYIGEKVLVSGIISSVETFTTYTHDFVSVDGTAFGLKSRDIDLYQYSGSVDIKGEITDFRQELPIITVTEIIGANQGDAESSGDQNTDYYFFRDVGLGFDLSVTDGYVVEQQADEIVLIDMETGSQPEAVMTIAPFVCRPGDNLKDCQALQQTFTQMNNETYVSAHDITFYNLTETKTRAAFNKGYGYYVTPTQEGMFTTFADLISFMSQERIQEAVTAQAPTLCKDINQSLTQVTSNEFNYSQLAKGVVGVTLRGLDADGQSVGCELSVRLGNSLKVMLRQFLPSTDGTPTQQQQVVIPEDDAELPSQNIPSEDDNTDDDTSSSGSVQQLPDFSVSDGVTPPTQTEKPADYENWLEYASIRGYTMYFSNKGISYAGQIIEPSDVNVGGSLSCSYQLNVIQWSRADQIDTNPDVVIYECTGTPSASDLAAGNFQQVGTTTSGSVFVAKYLTTNLGGMNIQVE